MNTLLMSLAANSDICASLLSFYSLIYLFIMGFFPQYICKLGCFLLDTKNYEFYLSVCWIFLF